jgi:peroxiredoxin
MKTSFLPYIVAGLVAACSSQIQAADPLPGHSMQGEAFNEGPRQRAYLMGGTGKVHLPVTANNEEAVAFFDQGVGQLHGFWYFEAERSFRQVAALDGDCAMAYWGMAIANINNPKRAKGFIEKATATKAKASPREQSWIAAYADYFSDKKPDHDRRRDLVKALEDITLEYPDEIEAKAFLLFHIWDNSRNGLPISSRLAVDALVKEVLAHQPLHPAHHYMIHLWDEEKPVRALASASVCGQSAPNVAHMWHMSGHIYSKVKRYADAVWQQDAAARVDHRFMIRDWVLPDQIHNYAHNNQWLVENLEYIGRAHDAVALAKNLIELPRHPKYNTLGQKDDGTLLDQNHGSAGEGRRRLFETLTRYELWNEVIFLADSVYLEPTDIPAERVKRNRLLGLAYLIKGDSAFGWQQIHELEATQTKLRANRFAAAEAAEAKAKKDKKPAPEITKVMAEAMQKFSDALTAVENGLSELRGFEALSRGNLAQAKAAFESANDIPRDRLARIALQLGDKDRAVKLAREEVAAGDKQVCPLANLVDILNHCGQEKEAQDEFTKLRELAADADLDVPAMRRLASLAAKLQMPGDWRTPRPIPADVGCRPALDELGPRHWQPWPAPDWQLLDVTGRTVSNRDFAGKPVIMIAHLGNGCVHCLEQIKAFSAIGDQFSAAGIELLAVSTDPLPESNGAAATARPVSELPIKCLADPELTFFKKFRAYDDFENRPLHGTYFIDQSGRVRWQDVSHEPFNDVAFLLAEAKRQLAQSNSSTRLGNAVQRR